MGILFSIQQPSPPPENRLLACYIKSLELNFLLRTELRKTQKELTKTKEQLTKRRKELHAARQEWLRLGRLLSEKEKLYKVAVDEQDKLKRSMEEAQQGLRSIVGEFGGEESEASERDRV